MHTDLQQRWVRRLDKFCAVTGSLVPVGLVVGNIGFEAIVGLVGLVWIVRWVAAKENPFCELVKHPLMIPWATWFLCMLASLLVNGPGSKGWAHDVVFIRYVLFGLALLDVSRRQPVASYFVYGLAAGVVWAALNTLSAYLVGMDFLGKPLIRYTGKLKEAARISALSAYAAAFFLSWGMLDSRLTGRRKAMILLIGSIAFIQVLQTHVRTAILAAAAGMFFTTAFFVHKRKSWGLAVAMVVLIVLGIGAMVFFSDLLNLNSMYDRIYFWRVSWRMWLDHPVFGIGISAFQDAYKEMAASGAIQEYVAPSGRIFSAPEQTHSHNIFLMLLACTGVLGLAAFIWLYTATVRMIFRDLREFRYGLIAWPVVLIVIGLTGFNIYHSWYQAMLAFMLVAVGAAHDGGAPHSPAG